MIQANELRYGNWIKVYGVVKQVWVITENDINDEGNGDHIQPIPLTPEILIAAGFEKLPGSKYVYRIFSDDIEISVSTELFFAYIDTMWGQAPIKKPIVKHLHQLQTLYFALTGKELSIKL